MVTRGVNEQAVTSVEKFHFKMRYLLDKSNAYADRMKLKRIKDSN